MSGPRMAMTQMNGSNNRRPNSSSMTRNERPTCAQHEDLIKYIYDAWTKVEMDSRATASVMYYQEQANHHLKDFRPFDLEAYWGRRMHQNIQQHRS